MTRLKCDNTKITFECNPFQSYNIHERKYAWNLKMFDVNVYWNDTKINRLKNKCSMLTCKEYGFT